MNQRSPFAPGVITTEPRRTLKSKVLHWLDRGCDWLFQLTIAVVLVALAALIALVLVSNHLDENLLAGVIFK